MTLDELFQMCKATLEGDPSLANENVMVAMRSLKGCHQRCLLDIDSVDMHGKTTILMVEDRN